jgi:hypothetical protein
MGSPDGMEIDFENLGDGYVDVETLLNLNVSLAKSHT